MNDENHTNVDADEPMKTSLLDDDE